MPGDFPAVSHVEYQNMLLRHHNSFDLLQKDFVVEFLQLQDFFAFPDKDGLGNTAFHAAILAPYLV